METNSYLPDSDELSGGPMRWWIAVGMILVLICLLVGVDATVRYANAHRRAAMPSVNETPSDAQQALLGGWREVSSTYYDSASTSTPKTTDYATSSDSMFLGFVINGGLGIMRTYDAPGDAAELTQLQLWKISSSSSEGLAIETFAYGTSTNGYPFDRETIHFVTPDKIVVRSNFDDGSTYVEQTFLRSRSASEEAAMDFARTAEQTQALCDEVLAGSSTERTSTLLPLSCAADIGPRDDPATFTFGADGSLTVKSGDRVILELHEADPLADDASNTVDLIDSGGSSGPFLNNFGAFTLQDVTFDGYKDIAVLTNQGAYNQSYDYYAFNPRNGVYDPEPIVSATNPYFDPAARTITDFNKGRGIGDIYTANTYHFENGAYVLVERVKQDLKDQENYDSSAGYVLTDEKRINGVLRVVKTTKLSEADVMGDQSAPIINGN